MTSVALKLARTQARDAFRSRWIAVYAGFFLVLSEGLLRFSDGDAKAVVSLGTAALMVVPLATLVLATIYVYNARDFTELLLAQPIRRSSLFAGLYLGLALPMAAGFVGGAGLPFLVHGVGDPAQRGAVATLLALGAALTFVFAGLAFCIALAADDRLRGLGIALGVWLMAALLYDAVVMLAVVMLSDYPVERPLLVLTLANPIDLARVLLVLQLDISALMGYTGAVFKHFFGGAAGSAVAAASLVLWIAVPLAAAARQFRRKDF